MEVRNLICADLTTWPHSEELKGLYWKYKFQLKFAHFILLSVTSWTNKERKWGAVSDRSHYKLQRAVILPGSWAVAGGDESLSAGSLPHQWHWAGSGLVPPAMPLPQPHMTARDLVRPLPSQLGRVPWYLAWVGIQTQRNSVVPSFALLHSLLISFQGDQLNKVILFTCWDA